jgi:hypothetical protein
MTALPACVQVGSAAGGLMIAPSGARLPRRTARLSRRQAGCSAAE